LPCQTRTTADRAASRPRAEGGELYSASFAKAGYAPLPEYVEPIDSPVSKPGSDYPLVLTAFRSINYCDQQHRNIPRLRRGVPDPVVERWQGCRELVSLPHRSLMCRVSLVRLNREP
jgi:anaerobic selenocysteine-containing dehydrogenase